MRWKQIPPKQELLLQSMPDAANANAAPRPEGGDPVEALEGVSDRPYSRL